jgi:hypothetical protein
MTCTLRGLNNGVGFDGHTKISVSPSQPSVVLYFSEGGRSAESSCLKAKSVNQGRKLTNHNQMSWEQT